MRTMRLQELKTLSVRGHTVNMEKPNLVPDSVALQPCAPFPHLLILHIPFLRKPPLVTWVLFSSLDVPCLLDLNLSLRRFLFLHWVFVMPIGNYPFLRLYSISGWALEIENLKKWNPPKINSLFYSSQLCLIELLVFSLTFYWFQRAPFHFHSIF